MEFSKTTCSDKLSAAKIEESTEDEMNVLKARNNKNQMLDMNKIEQTTG